jgi:hypothetical protein
MQPTSEMDSQSMCSCTYKILSRWLNNKTLSPSGEEKGSEQGNISASRKLLTCIWIPILIKNEAFKYSNVY